MVKAKTSKYAITYIPSKDRFAVNKLSRGETIKKQYRRNTSIIRASSPSQALKKLSQRSYRVETKKKLKI